MLLLILTFVLAVLLALAGVPVARRAALKFGMVDAPDGRLKRQQEPVPYLGGLAVYLAFLVSLAFTFEFRQDVLGMILGGTLIVMLGLIDDFGVLSPGVKLAGQGLAVFVLIKSGICIQIAALPDWLALALTVVWMLGIINAFNLLDIMDGLSAGVGLIASLFLLAVALLNGDRVIAFMVTALAGSLLGFLRYNVHPARIYMGDAGALFLGFMLGALAMIGQYRGSHPLALAAPLLILGVPIFDTLYVMGIRWRRGRPVFLGSPDHPAIRLRQRGLSVPGVVILSYGASLLMGGVGLAVLCLDGGAAAALVGATLGGLALAGVLLTRLESPKPVPAPSLGARGGAP